MKNETKLFYDLTAEKTAQEWYENTILMPTIEEFVALLPKNPKILDLGCGPGHETKRLATLGADVIGIDYSRECVRIAKERCPKCKFKIMDFRNPINSFGQFDGVFASGSLIHLKSDELPDVISRIAGLLKRNGLLLIIIQDGKGINEKHSHLEVGGKILRRPVYCYTKNNISRIAEKCDLKFVKEGYLDKNLIEHNWKNYIFKRRK